MRESIAQGRRSRHKKFARRDAISLGEIIDVGLDRGSGLRGQETTVELLGVAARGAWLVRLARASAKIRVSVASSPQKDVPAGATASSVRLACTSERRATQAAVDREDDRLAIDLLNKIHAGKRTAVGGVDSQFARKRIRRRCGWSDATIALLGDAELISTVERQRARLERRYDALRSRVSKAVGFGPGGNASAEQWMFFGSVELRDVSLGLRDDPLPRRLPRRGD